MSRQANVVAAGALIAACSILCVLRPQPPWDVREGSFYVSGGTWTRSLRPWDVPKALRPEPRTVGNWTKAEASKNIEELQQKTGRGKSGVANA